MMSYFTKVNSTCYSFVHYLLVMQEHKGILSLPQDCFYRDLTPDEAANIKSFNFDHPSAYDFPEIIAAVKTLKSGNAADIPVYDFVTSKRLPAVVHVPYAGEPRTRYAENQPRV
jgi:uridine kinase